jgi:hypothetical protein
MEIQEAVRRILEDGTARTRQQILDDVPDVASRPHAPECLLLMMRLDPRIQQVDAERWTVTNRSSSRDQRIIELTQLYLDRLPSAGGMISSAVKEVVAQTGYTPDIVEAVIAANFHTLGKALLNKRKATL